MGCFNKKKLIIKKVLDISCSRSQNVLKSLKNSAYKKTFLKDNLTALKDGILGHTDFPSAYY